MRFLASSAGGARDEREEGEEEETRDGREEEEGGGGRDFAVGVHVYTALKASSTQPRFSTGRTAQ